MTEVALASEVTSEEPCETSSFELTLLAQELHPQDKVLCGLWHASLMRDNASRALVHKAKKVLCERHFSRLDQVQVLKHLCLGAELGALGKSLLERLSKFFVSPQTAHEAIEVVLIDERLGSLIRSLTGLHEQARQTPANRAEAVKALEMSVTRTLRNITLCEPEKDMESDVQTISEEILRSIERNDRKKCIKSGMPELDRLIGGVEEGHVWVVAGRPGRGKTAFGLQVALNAAREGKGVVFCSLEMPTRQLLLRLSANVADYPLQDIRLCAGHTFVEQALSTLAQLPMRYVEPPRGSLNALETYLYRTPTPDLLVIDYLQLLTLDSFKGSPFELVSQISKHLKRLAMSLRIPILALAQLSRQAEDQTPKIHHLRESGQIEQDADQIVLLSSQDSLEPTLKLTLDLAKNRHGPVGSCYAHFHRPTLRISQA